MQLTTLTLLLAGIRALAEGIHDIEAIPAILERRQRHSDDEFRLFNRTTPKGLHLLSSQQRVRLQTELEQILGPLLQQYVQGAPSTSSTTSTSTMAPSTAGPSILDASFQLAARASTAPANTSSQTEPLDSLDIYALSTLGESSTDVTFASTPLASTFSTSRTGSDTISTSTLEKSSSASLAAPLTSGTSSATSTNVSSIPTSTPLTSRLTSLRTFPTAPLSSSQISLAQTLVPTPDSILNLVVAPSYTFDQLMAMEMQLQSQLSAIRDWILALAKPGVSGDIQETFSTAPETTSTQGTLSTQMTINELIDALQNTQDALINVLYQIGDYLQGINDPDAQLADFSSYISDVVTEILDAWQDIAASLTPTSTSTNRPVTTPAVTSTKTSISNGQSSTRVFASTFLDASTSDDASSLACLDLTRTWLASALSNLTRVRITVDQDNTQALIRYTDLRATGLTSSLVTQLTEELEEAIQLCTNLSSEAFKINVGVDEKNELMLHTEAETSEGLEDIISILTFSE